MRYGAVNERAALIFDHPAAPAPTSGLWAFSEEGTQIFDYVYVDVATATSGCCGPDPMDAFNDWERFLAWAAEVDPASHDAEPFSYEDLTCPVPRPSQVFGIGLNYADHASETSHELPENPLVFTKFPSSLAGPTAEVPLVEGKCDWEVELVVVVGRTARSIPESVAVSCIAGFSVGQDVSERVGQMAGERPQFNLAKSYRNFAPLGPALVTLDELKRRGSDPWDLGIYCVRNGEYVQNARTNLLIHKIPRLLAYISSICELRAGDLIFTGTPSGVGLGMDPPQFLQPGDEIISSIEGIGEIRNRCV